MQHYYSRVSSHCLSYSLPGPSHSISVYRFSNAGKFENKGAISENLWGAITLDMVQQRQTTELEWTPPLETGVWIVPLVSTYILESTWISQRSYFGMHGIGFSFAKSTLSRRTAAS
ncbi:hypothetical protein I7I53_11101 [Histoplasma capsulatum var. duboisii H88]|uniref:Uncharacterized protein n=1 Tax=Ajellomyces capsulatus (strain H88) TaxID=544711 RepID=A0A8A1L8X8_AJEC8|nr:hypothetical protein I7I53_11101 [Histoplasma capsulatum var. duboisii H88]